MLSQVNKHVRIYYFTFRCFKMRWNVSLHRIYLFSLSDKNITKAILLYKAHKADLGAPIQSLPFFQQ